MPQGPLDPEDVPGPLVEAQRVRRRPTAHPGALEGLLEPPAGLADGQAAPVPAREQRADTAVPRPGGQGVADFWGQLDPGGFRPPGPPAAALGPAGRRPACS